MNKEQLKKAITEYLVQNFLVSFADSVKVSIDNIVGDVVYSTCESGGIEFEYQFLLNEDRNEIIDYCLIDE